LIVEFQTQPQCIIILTDKVLRLSSEPHGNIADSSDKDEEEVEEVEEEEANDEGETLHTEL